MSLVHHGVVYATTSGERILSFKSDIVVNEDRSMRVVETIRVVARGQKIKRGIYRDFPTDYTDRYGNRYRVAFDISTVTLDGNSAPFKTERRANGVRVYIGDPNVFLEPGEYEYEIHYRTNRQLGFFDEHDELYWNVTGNEWDFVIETVEATIRLPRPVRPEEIKLAYYTGAIGSRDKHALATVRADGSIYFETTRALGQREGLTIVAGWPKGIIPEPTSQEKFAYLLDDNQHIVAALISLAVLSLYYLFFWNRVGRDPEAGVIVAHYEPPPGYSPAAMRYIEKMDYDKTCFTAALLNLAVKGYLTIAEDKGVYTLTKTGKEIELTKAESTLTRHLFDYGDSVVLKQSNHKRIGDALDRHEQALSNEYENVYFRTNLKFFVIGVIMTIVAVVITTMSATRSSGINETIFLSFWAAIWWFATGSGLIRAWNMWRHSHGVVSKFAALFQMLFLVPFVAVGVFFVAGFASGVNWPVIAFLCAVIILNFVFYQLLKAPTLAGRKLLDNIAGFRHYVDIAEKHELDYRHPEGKTPELFERYLPFALALGIEQKWSEQFDEVIKSTSADGEAYAPRWYSGSHWNPHNVSGFSSSVGSSLGSAIASSSTAPGSSSGFGGGGGGGSSGGGGGGGGGGGW